LMFCVSSTGSFGTIEVALHTVHAVFLIQAVSILVIGRNRCDSWDKSLDSLFVLVYLRSECVAHCLGVHVSKCLSDLGIPPEAGDHQCTYLGVHAAPRMPSSYVIRASQLHAISDCHTIPSAIAMEPGQ